MVTKTFSGDIIPDANSGYAHYWIKMIVTETASTSTSITGTCQVYFMVDGVVVNGYHFNNGNSLNITIGSTSIYSTANVGSIQVSATNFSQKIADVTWSGTKDSNGAYSQVFKATFSQTQSTGTAWKNGVASGTFTGTTVSPTNTYVYTGSAWKKGVVYVYNGSAWKQGLPNVYNSGWKK